MTIIIIIDVIATILLNIIIAHASQQGKQIDLFELLVLGELLLSCQSNACSLLL